jgi:hypothetical protein
MVGAGLRWVLALWLPAVPAIVAGLYCALATGQADPWIWAPPTAILMAAYGWFGGRHDILPVLWTAAGCVGAALLLCGLASGRMPLLMQSVGLASVGLCAALGGVFLRRASRRGVGAGLGIVMVIFLWLGPRADLITGAASRPTLAVVSALPLFWREGGMDRNARVDAPIVTLLRARFDVRPVDTPRDGGLARFHRLLLAQPRAMAPDELVAIDAWVRAGGQALILADPLLRWPSALPPGDRRRAPVVSLLAPLLAHWGTALESPRMAGETRRFLRNDKLVTLSGASRFAATAGSCRAEEAGLVMRCAIGQGQVILVADADLIDDRLWLADPARPRDPRAWVADTPQMIARWLGADIAGQRRWVRNGEDLVRALRWTALAGMEWAILGAGLMLARNRGSRASEYLDDGRRTGSDSR